jgi:hypothetical protein
VQYLGQLVHNFAFESFVFYYNVFYTYWIFVSDTSSDGTFFSFSFSSSFIAAFYGSSTFAVSVGEEVSPLIVFLWILHPIATITPTATTDPEAISAVVPLGKPFGQFSPLRVVKIYRLAAPYRS